MHGWMMVLAVSVIATPAGAQAIDARHRGAIQAIEQRMAPLPRSGGSRTPAPITDRMAEAKVPAVSVALIENGRVVWARAYGKIVAGSGRAVTPVTRFQAASMSKAVAAAGMLMLVDRGVLSMDDDVNARLRGWRVPAPPSMDASVGPVTLRRLLSHTAGLSVAGYPGYPGYAADAPVPSIVQSLAGAAPANTAAVRAFAAPGAQVAYSGGGYTVAQLLASEAAGRDFADLMRGTVLRRAGMRHSSFDQPLRRAAADAATAHDDRGVPIAGGSHRYPELAAAGLWTTPTDYGRFLIALQRAWTGERHALLKPDTVRAMTTPVMDNYGLGVFVVQAGGRPAITHGGSNAGFQCRFFAFLDGRRESVVIMTNGDNGGALAAAVQRTLGQAYGWPDSPGTPLPRAPDV